MSSAEVLTANEKIMQALQDLHDEFHKASRLNAKEYDGPAKAAERSIRLIDAYAAAVARVAGYHTPMWTVTEAATGTAVG